MAMPSLLLIFLFLSTLHACDARRLQSFKSSSSVSKIELHSISPRFQTDRLERSFDKNNNEKISSMENIVGIKMLKGMKKHGRLAMELPLKDKVLNNSEENEVGEDMVVMDYAQPHRKPPIHNEKP